MEKHKEGGKSTVKQEEVDKITYQLMRALSDVHAHEDTLVHRDIRPQNIFFTSDGKLRLGDFGLVVDLQGQSYLSTAGQRVDTKRYISPE